MSFAFAPPPMVLPFQGGWSVGAGGDSLIMAEQQPTGNRSTLESRLLTPPCSPPAWLLGTTRDSPIRRPSRIRSAVENDRPMCRTIRAMLAALCFASSPGLQPILPCLAQYRRDMLDWHKWELHASTRGAVTPFFCCRAPLGVRLFLSKRGKPGKAGRQAWADRRFPRAKRRFPRIQPKNRIQDPQAGPNAARTNPSSLHYPAK